MPTAKLLMGDCLAVLKALPDASVDAIVTDPPAGISFMGAKWDGAKGGRGQWIAWLASVMSEALRVARPGSRALVWALPRTSHWTATAVEDAGWTIEDRVSHLFGQGFPKHKSKLKPACEDWWLASKPMGKAVPLNIDGCRVPIVGDVDPARKSYGQPGNGIAKGAVYGDGTKNGFVTDNPHPDSPRHNAAGRWPAHLVLSHSPECREVGTKRVKGSAPQGVGKCWKPNNVIVGPVGLAEHGVSVKRTDADGLETVPEFACVEGCPVAELDRQSGGASRFFYIAKASRADRGEGNTHPTVKSQALMRWLCRLISPAGGTILDPFMGSGSTIKAALAEGFNAVGIEREPAFFTIAQRRIAEALASREVA